MENMPFPFSSFRFLSRGISILLLFFLVCAASPPKDSSDLPNFDALNEWLYRGAQPTGQGLRELKAKGIRTVVNFRDEPQWIEWEAKEVKALGMNYVSLPWSVWKPVRPELLDQFFKALDNAENRPVFFHCHHGRDRTGVMATLALMRYQNLSEKEARNQALGKIRPHLRYRYFVNQKINFFLKEKASES